MGHYFRPSLMQTSITRPSVDLLQKDYSRAQLQRIQAVCRLKQKQRDWRYFTPEQKAAVRLFVDSAAISLRRSNG